MSKKRVVKNLSLEKDVARALEAIKFLEGKDMSAVVDEGVLLYLDAHPELKKKIEEMLKITFG